MNRNIHIVITLLNAGIVKYILYWLIYSYIFYLHTKFQMPDSNGLLLVETETKKCVILVGLRIV